MSHIACADQATAAFFEQVGEGRDAKLVANWVMGEFFGALNRTQGATLENAPVGAAWVRRAGLAALSASAV